MKFCEKLQKLRKEKGYSQEQLAEIIDCSREHIARIENGKINIGLEYFIKLAQVFNISLDELAGYKKDWLHYFYYFNLKKVVLFLSYKK